MRRCLRMGLQTGGGQDFPGHPVAARPSGRLGSRPPTACQGLRDRRLTPFLAKAAKSGCLKIQKFPRIFSVKLLTQKSCPPPAVCSCRTRVPTPGRFRYTAASQPKPWRLVSPGQCLVLLVSGPVAFVDRIGNTGSIFAGLENPDAAEAQHHELFTEAGMHRVLPHARQAIGSPLVGKPMKFAHRPFMLCLMHIGARCVHGPVCRHERDHRRGLNLLR